MVKYTKKEGNKDMESVKEYISDTSGQSMGLLGWIGLFLAITIFGGVSAVVAGAVRDTQAVNSYAYNASNNGLVAIVNFTAQLGSAGTIAGLAVLVAAAVMILGYFGWRQFGQ